MTTEFTAAPEAREDPRHALITKALLRPFYGQTDTVTIWGKETSSDASPSTWGGTPEDVAAEIVAALAADEIGQDRCEGGCGPAVMQDSEGTPLCLDCGIQTYIDAEQVGTVEFIRAKAAEYQAWAASATNDRAAGVYRTWGEAFESAAKAIESGAHRRVVIDEGEAQS